jgi:hypothetical protein
MRIVVFLILALSCGQAQAFPGPSDKAAKPTEGINLNLQLPPSKPESHIVDIVKVVCELLAALAWPAVVTGLLIAGRGSLPKLINALTALVERSDHVKVLDVIDLEVKRAGQKAQQKNEIVPEIPEEDREAADRVGGLFSDVKGSDIEERMFELASEYEKTRARMSPGQDRTRAMNAIVARMHTLAMLAQPLLPTFATSDQPGRRLAAIAILELAPSLDYVPWLVERIRKEVPFLLFHASLALRETAKKYRDFAGPGLRDAVSRSLQALDQFERESSQIADANTKAVLLSTLSMLGQASDA